MGVQTVLFYGCESIRLGTRQLKKLKTTQGNLVKAFLGLRRSSRTSPLLQDLGLKSPYQYVNIQLLKLLHSCLSYQSSANDFYSHLLTKSNCMSWKGTLLDRVTEFCHSLNTTVLSSLISKETRGRLFGNVMRATCSKGLLDSISYICSNYDFYARDLLQGLVTVSFN